MLIRNNLGAILICLLASSLTCAQNGILEIHVRDVQTHYSVPATVKMEGPQTLSADTDNFGDLKLKLVPGEYREEVSAPGYQTMRSHAAIQLGKTSPMGFMLDPLAPPPEEKELDAKLKHGFTLLHGYAVDEHGRPVEGVRVYLQKAHVEGATNKRGFFWLSAPTPPQAAPDIPGMDTLIAQKAGYKTICHRNILVGGAEGGGYLLDMVRGRGNVEFDDTHHLLK